MGPGAQGDGERLRGDVSHIDGGVVVQLTGDLDMSSAPRLLQQCKSLLGSPIEHLDLDLARVSFVDSTGISALIETRRIAKREGVPFRLVAVPQPTMRAFDVAGVSDLFEIRGDD
jgi:anti-sigma B factor antagonist